MASCNAPSSSSAPLFKKLRAEAATILRTHVVCENHYNFLQNRRQGMAMLCRRRGSPRGHIMSYHASSNTASSTTRPNHRET